MILGNGQFHGERLPQTIRSGIGSTSPRRSSMDFLIRKHLWIDISQGNKNHPLVGPKSNSGKQSTCGLHWLRCPQIPFDRIHIISILHGNCWIPFPISKVLHRCRTSACTAFQRNSGNDHFGRITSLPRPSSGRGIFYLIPGNPLGIYCKLAAFIRAHVHGIYFIFSNRIDGGWRAPGRAIFPKQGKGCDEWTGDASNDTKRSP